MANRIIRDWTNSENVEKLSFGAEAFFVRLIMKADDYGCYHGNPKLLIAYLFPLKEISDKEIKIFIKECLEAKLIKMYSDEEKIFLEITNFGQRLRQMNRKFPKPVKYFKDFVSSPLSDVSKKRLEVEVEVEVEVEGEYIAETSSADYKPVDDSFLGKEETASTESIDDKPKKEKPAGEPKPKSTYQLCMDVYNEFIMQQTTLPAKIDGAEGNALKAIIKYLGTVATDKTDQGIANSFLHILKLHAKWDPFHQNQIKLIQINSNLINIINTIKNGTRKAITNQYDQGKYR